jgi:hypothetical protein
MPTVRRCRCSARASGPKGNCHPFLRGEGTPGSGALLRGSSKVPHLRISPLQPLPTRGGACARQPLALSFFFRFSSSSDLFLHFGRSPVQQLPGPSMTPRPKSPSLRMPLVWRIWRPNQSLPLVGRVPRRGGRGLCCGELPTLRQGISFAPGARPTLRHPGPRAGIQSREVLRVRRLLCHA